MVQKSVKRGVHSGNTLRASNSKYNRLYRSQSCLVRNLKDSNSTDTLLDDLSITSDGIEYSLNKKGRWVVPQLLKEHILSNRKHACDEAVKIQLVESHKIKRVAKCIGFYASKGPVKKVLPRKKTYFNVASVHARNDRKKKAKSRKQRQIIENLPGNETDDEEPKISPELNIEIFYPSPETSSITHNPKYIRNWGESLNQSNEGTDQRSKTVQSKHGRSKKRVRMSSKCINEFIDDFEYTYFDEDEIFYQNQSQYKFESPQRSSKILLEDILFHASKMQSLCSSRQKKTRSSTSDDSENTNKTNVIYVNSEKTEESIQLQPSSGNDKSFTVKQCTTMLPVYVILPTADIQQQDLQELYGNSYMECRCFPRKFIIDITDRITSFARKSKILQGKSYTFDFTASVIFEYDMNTQLDSSDGNVYKVYLNLKSKLNSVQIETVSDFMQTTVNEIIQRTMFFVETIPPDNFYTHQQTSVSDTKKAVKFQNLDECLGTNTETYYPSNKFMYKEMFRNQQNMITSDNDAELGIEFVPPETCYICFDSAGEKSVTALQFCGHWFCDQCWQDHLRSRINMGYTKMTCPEYKCEAEVDNAILLTLINVEYVEQLAKRGHDSKVDMLKETKWCPNTVCGRVLKVQNVDKKGLNVKCGCGTNVCFDCLQPAHWPASCDYTVNYWTKLKKNGFKDVIPANFVAQVKVCGKSCPKCYRFIEKFGGCNYMACCCGAAFCWSCLKEWKSHPGSCKRENATRKEINHLNHEQVLSSRGHSKLYKMAVNHRANRHPWKTRVMKSNVQSLSKKLKYTLRKHCYRNEIEHSNFILAKNNMQTETENIPAFLSSIVDLYMEMNYVTEYTSVYLLEGKGHKSCMVQVLERMGHLIDSIFEIFNLGINQNIKMVIPNLLKLRQHSKRCIDTLVRTVSLTQSIKK